MNTLLLLLAMVGQEPVNKDVFGMLPSENVPKAVKEEKTPKAKVEYADPTPTLRKQKLYYMRDKNGQLWSNPNKEHLMEDVEKINNKPAQAKPKKFCRAEDKFGRTWQAETPEQLKKDLERANAVNAWPAQQYNIQPQMSFAPQTSMFRGGGAALCPPGAST